MLNQNYGDYNMNRLEKIQNEVQKIMDNDPAHDFLHIMRVYNNAELLCKKEKIESELILTSVLLHDIISFKKSDPHSYTSSQKSALLAKQILKKNGYKYDEIETISNAIYDHSFSKHKIPDTIEGKILQDADRLDAIGAIGIARTFSVGGSENRQIYNAEDPFCKNRIPDDKKWTVDHFYKKLLKIEKLMNTKTGKSVARERTLLLKLFLKNLRYEIRNIG